MLVLDEGGDTGCFECGLRELSLQWGGAARRADSLYPLRLDESNGGLSLYEDLAARGADDNRVVELTAEAVPPKIGTLVVPAMLHSRRLTEGHSADPASAAGARRAGVG